MKKIAAAVIAIPIIAFLAFFLLGKLFMESYIDETLEDIAARPQNGLQVAPPEKKTAISPFLRDTSGDSHQPALTILKLKGEVRTGEDENWKKIKETAFFRTDEPEFVEIANLKMSELLDALVVERYIDGKASQLVKALSSITLSEGKGEQLDLSYFIRYYMSSVYYPSALTNQNSEWTEISEGEAGLNVKRDTLEANLRFYFNGEGEVEKIVTGDRFRTTNAGYLKQVSTINFSNYREINGQNIPMNFSLEWNSDFGDFLYARYEIEDIKYLGAIPEPDSLLTFINF